MIKTKDTIRNIAKIFGVSKSTTHKDLSERLAIYDKKKYYEVKEIITEHYNTRHLRGGKATQIKYKLLK